MILTFILCAVLLVFTIVILTWYYKTKSRYSTKVRLGENFVINDMLIPAQETADFSKTVYQDGIKVAGEAIADFATGVFIDKIKEASNTIGEFSEQLYLDAVKGISNLMKEIWDGIKTGATAAWDGIKLAAEETGKAIVAAGEAIAEAAKYVAYGASLAAYEVWVASGIALKWTYNALQYVYVETGQVVSAGISSISQLAHENSRYITEAVREAERIAAAALAAISKGPSSWF